MARLKLRPFKSVSRPTFSATPKTDFEFPTYASPALKRWAKLFGPSGTEASKTRGGAPLVFRLIVNYR